eukprot:7868451-Alexandrium_andersonii.AAC.1
MAGSSHENPWARRDPSIQRQPGPAVRPPGIRAGDKHDAWQALATGRDWRGAEGRREDWRDPADTANYHKSSGCQNLGETP